jgi:phosphatidate cytidylyltransferase
MALNVKTLGTRSLSAAVFVILLVGSVYASYTSFAIFFFIVSLLGLNEFYKISEKLDAQPYRISGYIFGILTYIFYLQKDFTGFDDFAWLLPSPILIFPFVILAVGLFSKRENSMRNSFFTICGIFYCVLPFCLLNQLSYYNIGKPDGYVYAPWLVLGIIFLIWSNDTFAYLGGSLFGKNKMIERVSPGKTWEGTAIGVLLTFALSFIFDRYVFHLTNNMWPVLGICIPVLATIGDLVESKLKREAGIKDSGSIMPGHGGALDRFDSLIFVSPFVYFLMMLFRF